MEVILPIPGSGSYTALPAFAKFIKDHHLKDYVREQLILSRQVKIPLLKYLEKYSDEQLMEISMVSSKELLEYLANNKPLEQMSSALTKWLQNQLGIVGKFDVAAEDITLINYVRGRSLKNLLPKFTTDIDSALLIAEEIDSFLFNSVTISSNAYIKILKEEISKREEDLLEAQEIGRIGSFEWDVNEKKLTKSPQVDLIYEEAPKTGLNNFITSVHPDDQAHVQKSFSDAYVTGEYECEYRYLVNGKTKYLWSKGRVHFNPDGSPAKLAGIIQDITNRKKIEIELQEKTTALSRTNENLQQFAYAASHDLKEPIRKIITFSNRLKTNLFETLSDSDKGMFNRLEDAATRMSELIDDLLTFSELDMNSSQLADVSLEEKTADVLSDLEILIEEKKASIEKTSLPVIKGHGRQIQQLLQNLISNALKYSKQDVSPVIQITSNVVKGMEFSEHVAESDHFREFHHIVVKDNGIGFNQEDAERIFNVFQRLHGKAEYGGTGIGLAIAAKVVETHHGYIWATSEPGLGSEFHVLFPRE